MVSLPKILEAVAVAANATTARVVTPPFLYTYQEVGIRAFVSPYIKVISITPMNSLNGLWVYTKDSSRNDAKVLGGGEEGHHFV